MPRNTSGVYTLPISSYVSGTTIKSADMNSNLSDIATALTQSVATTGVSSMTGPLKLSAGSAAAPSLTLASDVETGWYNSAAGTWTYVTGGTTIMSLSPTGGLITDLIVTNLTVTGSFSVAANRIVGEVVDYTGSAAPSLWLLAFGQAISRTTYSSLFIVVGTTFGAGDGSTTFNVPDYRGRISVGKDDMGGSTAGRITVAGCGVNGTTLGAVGGAQTHTLTTAQLSVHSHGISDPGHAHSYDAALVDNGASGGGTRASVNPSISTSSNTTGITISNAGSGSAHNNVQPIIIINKIIYTGV